MSQVVLDSTIFSPSRGIAGRALRKGATLGTAAADRILAPLVPLVCPRIDRPAPAVFIVGCPRSGSTLFYQSMVQSFRFAYISNIVARFPRSGPLVARLLRVDRRSAGLEFSSRYGETNGSYGPSEAGPFWDLAFPCREDHTVEASAWPDERRHFVQRHVASLAELYSAPFLCKNLWHSVRIEALNRAFPGAAFIVMRRDRLLVADSIFRQQKARAADGGRFWSIRPRGLAAKMELPLAEKVAWQIVLTERAIAKARGRLGQGRFFDVPYEEFCARPDSWMEQVGGFLQSLDIEVDRRASIDGHFVARSRCGLSAVERAQVEAVLRAS